MALEAVPDLEADEQTVIINSLISLRTSRLRMSGKGPLEYIAHELRAEGVTVSPTEDFLTVAVNLPYLTINIIPDGSDSFQLHIEESVGGPSAAITDKHIGPVPDAFVIGVVLGLKSQLEDFSSSLSAIQKNPRKAAAMGDNAAGRMDNAQMESKKTKAWHIVKGAGPEGIAAEELCRQLDVSLVKMRVIVGRLGRRFVIVRRDGELFVRYITKTKG
jgi:hypothetical protein